MLRLGSGGGWSCTPYTRPEGDEVLFGREDIARRWVTVTVGATLRDTVVVDWKSGICRGIYAGIYPGTYLLTRLLLHSLGFLSIHHWMCPKTKEEPR